MLKICLVFWKYEPQYAYKCYAYKKIFTSSQTALVFLLLRALSYVVVAKRLIVGCVSDLYIEYDMKEALFGNIVERFLEN